MINFKFDTKWLMNSLEKQMQDMVKNNRMGIKCPWCDSVLGNFSLKELNQSNKLYCKTCEKDVVVDLSKVDRKFK